MNTTMRRILRYTALFLCLIPLQVAFLGLSKLSHMAGTALLREITEMVYCGLIGFGLAVGHFLVYLFLRLWKKMRPEIALALWQGLIALSLYFISRNETDLRTAEGLAAYSWFYLWSFLFFLLLTALVWLVMFLRRRLEGGRNAGR